MKAILQRCRDAAVTIDGETVGTCAHGLMILLGVFKGDETADADLLAAKIAKLRIFDDVDGKLNLSVKDVQGSALVVSNFTLCADYRKGNRPDYFASEAPARAEELYEYFAAALRAQGLHVECGRFGADMKVSLINDGPVTIDMDSNLLKKS
ncbi:MAG: D-tyrosyl-tRNA(Tyr) deacylase [Clostridia bacterium]|nr:D-tyrosyl-tRNA(Tyr) deacylase [Clostridia bacterium]